MESNPVYKIGKSCHEKWGQMTPVEGGRNCAKCQLKVHDLSDMSAVNAQKYIAERDGNLCARMREGKFNLTQIQQKRRVPSRIRTFLVALLAAFGFLTGIPATANAQISNSGSEVRGNSQIEGNVVDGDGIPMPVVKITLKNYGEGIDTGTFSDWDGNFKFVEIPPGEYTIEAHYADNQSESREILVLADRTVHLKFEWSDLPQLSIGIIILDNRHLDDFDTQHMSITPNDRKERQR